jgi:hypothetical protein
MDRQPKKISQFVTGSPLSLWLAAVALRTKTDHPSDWALGHFNWGMAYRKRTGGAKRSNIKIAITHYIETLEVHI